VSFCLVSDPLLHINMKLSGYLDNRSEVIAPVAGQHTAVEAKVRTWIRCVVLQDCTALHSTAQCWTVQHLRWREICHEAFGMGCLLPRYFGRRPEPQIASNLLLLLFCTVSGPWVYRREIGLPWIQQRQAPLGEIRCEEGSGAGSVARGTWGPLRFDGVQAPRLSGESLASGTSVTVLSLRTHCVTMCRGLAKVDTYPLRVNY